MFLQLIQNGLFSDLFKYFKSKDYLFKHFFEVLQICENAGIVKMQKKCFRVLLCWL